jgi:hypothetical protein
MQSKVSDQAAQALIEAARKLNYEQRLAAFFEQSRLMTQLYIAGRTLRTGSAAPETR